MAIFGNDKKEKKEKVAVKRTAHATKPIDGKAHEIIRAPWFTEKALMATEKGVYVFEVPARASKPEIAGAVKEIYGVSPRMIRIVNVAGKKKALRTRRGMGQRSARSKAYVYLNAGDTIQFA